MSGPHARAAATATRLITRHGRAITLIAPGVATGPDYDPTPGVPVETIVVGVSLDVDASEIDGDTVLAHDRKYLFDGEPTITADMIIRDGADYAIRRVVPLAPGTTRVITTVYAGL